MSSTQRKGLLLIKLSESTNSQFGKVDFEKQPMPQKVFSALWTLMSEVGNGGFWQYFANSSAETAYFAVEALQIIGAHKTAEVTQLAINVAFPDGLPKDYEDIRAMANAHVEEKYRSLLQVRKATRQA